MQPDQSGPRLALVVGNANYRSVPRLKNAINDARAISGRLSDLGFRVRTEFDLDGEQFQRVVGEFCGEVAKAGGSAKTAKALLYFAGHGVQVKGHNYLLPVDGDIASEIDLKLRTIHLDIVIEAMGSAADTTVVFLDCCRDNPLPRTIGDGRTRSVSTSSGLASFDAPTGAFVAFATQPDNVAEDGSGDNSPFTAALLQFIDRPDTPISEMMIHVRRTVHARTSGRQIPWDRSALFEPFAFRTTGAGVARDQMTPEQAEEARENEYWSLIGRSDNIELLRSFVLQFPYGAHKPEAIRKIEELRRRQFVRGIWSKVATVAFVLVASVTLWYGQKWARFTTLGGDLVNADLIGGDQYLDAMHSQQTRGEPLWLCRFKCTISHECAAFSYDTKDGVCYRKFEFGFYERTENLRDTNSSVSEILRGSGRPAPVLSRFEMHWDRQLVGELVAREKVEADPRFKGTFKTLRRNNKQFWEASGIDCQRRCHELEGDCSGYTFSTFYRHCQIFKHVVGIAREPNNGPDLSFPATYSGCRSKQCRDAPKALPASVAPAPASSAPSAPPAAATVPAAPASAAQPAASPPTLARCG
jgi:uncharacterized caspase-like protein